MFIQRTAFALARRTPVRALARRTFSSSIVRSSKWEPKPGEPQGKIVPLSEIKTEEDLIPPGAAPGTIASDLEQATGLERMELLGKMEGIDIFNMKPLDASRLGTLEDPILVKSGGPEQYVGCTGYPVDSHTVIWLTVTRDRPLERCSECGNCIKMDYIGPKEDDHHHHAEVFEPKTMADFVKPEYWYK